MRFSSIKGKKLGELTHDEMQSHFTDHIFFRFMDRGREGMISACRDAIDNYIDHYVERKVIKKDAISSEEYEQYVQDFTLKCMSDFITRGSIGIKEALFSYHIVIAQHKRFQ